MPSYRVYWEIDIDADSPKEAAEKALAIQRNPESIATVFDVRQKGPCEQCRQHIIHKLGCPIRYLHAGQPHVHRKIEVDLTPEEG